MDSQQLEIILAQVIDSLDVARIVNEVLKCGGPGSGKPGPCPENKPRPQASRRPRKPGASGQKPPGGGSPPPPPPSSNIPPHEHEARVIRMLNAHNQALAQSGMPRRLRQSHERTHGRVIMKLTPQALADYEAHVVGYHFYPDTQSVTAAYQAGGGDPAHGEVGGFFDEHGGLHFDGETEAMILDVHAHEVGHAIDGNDQHRPSQSPAWRRAYQAEHLGGRLDQRVDNEQEAFAYFGMALILNDPPLEQLQVDYPQSYGFWVRRGFWR